MTDDLREDYNEVKIEDYIWIIYIFLAVFALISNYYEKEYLIKHQKKDEKNFRHINTFIFVVTFFIYLYFVFLNYKELKKLNPSSSFRDIIFTNASFISAVLFLLGGTIGLLISIFGTDDDNFIVNFF